MIHNTHVKAETEADKIKQALVAQTQSPVRWVETIEVMANNGVSLALEMGPGKVLMGLNKRIDKRFKTIAVYDDKSLHLGLEQAAQDH